MSCIKPTITSQPRPTSAISTISSGTLHSNKSSSSDSSDSSSDSTNLFLDYLDTFDRVNVYKNYVRGFDNRYKYRIANSETPQIFQVVEESNCCCRFWCRQDRSFRFRLLHPSTKEEAISVVRKYKCFAGLAAPCFDRCWNDPIHVEDRLGRTMGTIVPMTSGCSVDMRVHDGKGDYLYKITGPCRPCYPSCCGKASVYPITRVRDEEFAGVILRRWEECEVEMLGEVDNFFLVYNDELAIGGRHKALLLAAVFQVDFSVFEKMKCPLECHPNKLPNRVETEVGDAIRDGGRNTLADLISEQLRG